MHVTETVMYSAQQCTGSGATPCTSKACHPDTHTSLHACRLLRETFEPQLLTPDSRFKGVPGTVVEIGPRMSFSTAFSTNAVSIAASCGLAKVNRLERSLRYFLTTTRALTGQSSPPGDPMMLACTCAHRMARMHLLLRGPGQ